jgi:broad specificity phosphatase PhoE
MLRSAYRYMSSLYFIRHGQAGRRQSYDELSDLGRTQARLLGEYFAAQNIDFHAIFSGALTRQRETASEMAAAYAGAGRRAPEIAIDPNWNEFDLERVYEGMKTPLLRDDAQFRADYEELVQQMRDEHSAVHRTWSRADTAIVRAWVRGEYEYNGESFHNFCGRVRRSLDVLQQFDREHAIAIFTSATPVAVWMGLTLGVDGLKIMQLAGVMYNTAITVIRLRQSEMRLFGFNGVPHLGEPEMRTFR